MPLGMHAAVERRVPRLALVPRDQLQARSPTKATGQQQQRQTKQSVRRDTAHSIAGEQGIVKRQHEFTDEDAVRRGENDRELVEESNVECCKNDPGPNKEQQLRLGERFLRMMAAMAQLSCMPLDSHEDGGGDAEKQPLASSHTSKQQSGQQTTALEKIAQRKEAVSVQSTGSPAKGAAVPLLVPVNAATEPLRPHLTFEISMLLSPPIDTRQSSLQSPIRRTQLRPRRRKRRRRRPREKRSFQTSHTTWAPHASADYIQEHSRCDNRSSKLMEKFAQLKRAAEPSSSSQMTKSSSMLMLGDRRYLYAFPPRNRSASVIKSDQRSSDENDENGCDEEESGSDSGKSEGESEDGQEEQEEQDQNQDAQSENNEPTFSSFFTHSASNTAGIGEVATSHTYPRNEAAPPIFSDTATPCDDDTSAASSFPPSTTAVATTTPARKHPLFHQPAWISPELKSWLVTSGMFQTKSRHALIR